MDYLSDTTKKERRSLLASGFIGIIVAQLKVYPTEIDVLGMKFRSVDLPFIAIGGLCAIVVYFLVKFFFSFLYEHSARRKDALATQIRTGQTLMDIAREELLLEQKGREIIQQQKANRDLERQEVKRQKDLQDKIDQDNIAHETALAQNQKKQIELELAVASNNLEAAKQYIVVPHGMLFGLDLVQAEIESAKQALAYLAKHREEQLRRDMKSLQAAKHNWIRKTEELAVDMRKKEEDFVNRQSTISEWKRVHTLARRISPLHCFLEIALPIMIGIGATCYLIMLMLNFPDPPPKPSLPEF